VRTLALAVLLALAPTESEAARPLTLLFSGTNAGEIAPCGCRSMPAGGLPRRKKLIDDARAAGPVVVLDAGDALFRTGGIDDPQGRVRAELILSAMGRMGTVAMAAGSRDLLWGPLELKAAAARAKVPVLSANLVGEDRRPLFPASTIATVGGVKIGVVGVSPAGPFGSMFNGTPPVPAALAEARRLRGQVDLLVVLAPVPHADAVQVAVEGKGLVDLVLHAEDGRGTGPLQRTDGAFLVPTGERGRALGKLSLELSGPPGSWTDLSEAQREKELAGLIAGQLTTLRKRLAAARSAAVKKDLQEAIEGLQASKKGHEEAAKATRASAGRRAELSWVVLAPDLKEDAALRDEVEKLEPPRSGR
jgi:2',3'-cyclic-nucleotide 2'-phosphodiesterase (5'-nucleotidase family)